MVVHKYHDYTAKDKVLPEDINEPAIKAADKLDSTGELTEMLKEVQEKKHFGEQHFINPAKGRLEALFEFHNGVCKKFKLIKWSKSGNSYFMMTVLNNKVTFKRG